MMKFALHVITGAGFGTPFTWEASTDDVPPNHQISFREAISSTLAHILTILITPKLLLRTLPFRGMRDSNLAYDEFGRYMRDLVEREKALGEKSDGQNLLAALAKFSGDSDDVKGKVMTDDEIIGNIFVFLMAGHETTYFRRRTVRMLTWRAHTLLYAFLMLAIHPEIQDILAREIDATIGNRTPTYDDFPELVYPLCVMFETLRLFPPVVCIPKATLNGPQMVLGKYLIPKDCTIFFDVVGLHRSERYWGADAAEYNPSRFDGRGVEGQSVHENGEDTFSAGINEKIRIPFRSAFLPFSEGSRSCLGTPRI
jgi:cytochrome P450